MSEIVRLVMRLSDELDAQARQPKVFDSDRVARVLAIVADSVENVNAIWSDEVVQRDVAKWLRGEKP